MELLTAGIISDVWQDQIVANNREAIFLLLVGFLGAFLFIRTSARLGRSTTWWPGSVVTDDGVHLHHLVWGICTMMAAGALGFSLHGESPWFEVSALFFGIGMGLTIDEFALWVYLDDVYWAEEGRKSIDAAAFATAVIGLLLLGFNPFEKNENLGAVLLTTALIVVFCSISFAKERIAHGLLGLFIPLFSIYAAFRLAKPRSLWARKFYGERRPDKQQLSEDRYNNALTGHYKERMRDFFGGKTNAELEKEGRRPVRASESEESGDGQAREDPEKSD